MFVQGAQSLHSLYIVKVKGESLDSDSSLSE